MLWRVEFFKHMPVFAVACGLSIVCGLAVLLFPDTDFLVAFKLLGNLLCWNAVIFYAAWIIFGYLALGRDVMLQIGTVSRWRLVWMKAAVLSSLMFGLHLVCLAFDLKVISEVAGDKFGIVILYLLGGRLLSFAAFFVAVVFAATAVKALQGKTSEISGFCMFIVALIATQIIILRAAVMTSGGTGDTLVIGASNFLTVDIYSNVLPVILVHPLVGGVLPDIWVLSVALNAGAALFFGALWRVLAKKMRFNFLPL